MDGDEKVNRFEAGAQVAWMLDVEGGYRGVSDRSWQLASVEQLPGGRPSLLRRRARVDVTALADDERLPRVTIAPIAGERLRVRSEIDLVAQPYGEPVPHRAGSVVEVSYGSVLRVGPFLFSVLYAEQAESLQTGAMLLPFIGGGFEGPADPAEVERDRELAQSAKPLGRRRRVLALACLVALALSVGAIFFFTRPALSPRRVLVVLQEFQQDGPDRLGARLEATLRGAGFEPIPASGPACEGDLHDPEALEGCARAHLAEQSLRAWVEVIEERPGLVNGSVHRVVRTTAEVRQLGLDDPQARLKVTSAGEVSSSTERLPAQQGDDLEGALLPELLATLVGPQLAEPDFFSDVAVEEYDGVVERRRRAERITAAWTSRRGLHQRSCETAEAALHQDRGPAEVRYLTGACEEEYPLALTADGRELLLQVETATPIFTYSEDPDIHRHLSPERIDLLTIDSGERRALMKARNFLGFGALAAEAGKLYVVEQSRARYGLHEISLRGGIRLLLYHVDSPARIVNPVPSPDGAWIVLWRRSDADEREVPVLLASSGGEPRPLPESTSFFRWVRIHLPGRAGPELLLAALSEPEELDLPAEGEDQLDLPQLEEVEALPEPRWSVSIIDPTTAEEVARFTDPEHDADEIVGELNGRLLVTTAAPCALSTWEPLSGTSETLPLERCLRRPVLTGGGVLVAGAVVSAEGDTTGSDEELVRVDLRSGALTPLTANRVNDRNITTARSSSRVAFSRLLSTPTRRLPRVAVMVMDLDQ